MERKAWREREVWDPWLRSFHWLLVASVALAWWTHGGDPRSHLLAGAAIGGLLAFRLFWGLGGAGHAGRHAQFASFAPGWRDLLRHARTLLRGRAFPAEGHPPLGALMVFALLLALGWMWLSGMMLAGLRFGIGPFAPFAGAVDFAREAWIADWHERIGGLLPWMAGVHLAGVLTESVLARENLVRAMITGRKRTGEGV